MSLESDDQFMADQVMSTVPITLTRRIAAAIVGDRLDNSVSAPADDVSAREISARVSSPETAVRCVIAVIQPVCDYGASDGGGSETPVLAVIGPGFGQHRPCRSPV